MVQPGRSGRIAFFGGSFDPPHRGHLAVAHAARAALHLDTVLFAPVGIQPLKPQGATTAFADRVAMTRLAIAGEPDFAVCLADAPQPAGAPNYSFETLKKLQAELPGGHTLFCLMGADSFLGLRQWHRAKEIPFLAPLIVASRPGQALDRLEPALPEGLALQPVEQQSEAGIELRTYAVTDASGRRAPFYLLPGLDVEISASEIRAQVRAAGASAHSIPGEVAAYIRSHGLYRG